MGTPNISGQYEGTFNIAVRAYEGYETGQVQAFSGTADNPLGVLMWTFNFATKTMTIEDGRLTPKEGLMPPANYFDFKARNPENKELSQLSFEESPDDPAGVYTVSYNWEVKPDLDIPILPPVIEANTFIKLEITQLKDGSIAVVTYRDSDHGGIPGTPLPEPFPLGAMPDWRGRATSIT